VNTDRDNATLLSSSRVYFLEFVTVLNFNSSGRQLMTFILNFVIDFPNGWVYY